MKTKYAIIHFLTESLGENRVRVFGAFNSREAAEADFNHGFTRATVAVKVVELEGPDKLAEAEGRSVDANAITPAEAEWLMENVSVWHYEDEVTAILAKLQAIAQENS